MVFPSAEQIENRIFKDHILILPDSVRDGIGRCLASSTSEIENAKTYLSNSYMKDFWSPPDVRYESDATIDAYTIDYLPRNFFIPRIAFRDLALCRKAVRFNEIIRILDIGSGTGAVSLGTFELFSSKPLSDLSIYFFALDSSVSALKRQVSILKESGLLFKRNTFMYKPVDLSDVSKVQRILSSRDPWDIIFSANFMSELDSKTQRKLVPILAENLSKNGSIIIAEPAQNRGRKVPSDISKLAQEVGLTVYYPCAEDTECLKPQCWNWREYQIGYIKHLLRNGRCILFSDKSLLISMLILNKNEATIFDPFRAKHPDLKWGIIAPVKKFGEYELCSLRFIVEPYKYYSRGSIIGCKEVKGKVIIEVYRTL